MDRQSYKIFHQYFVSNHQGTTFSEISLISLVCPLSVLVLLKLERWCRGLNKLWRLLIEFLILVGPLLVIFTDMVNPFDAVFWFAILGAFVNVIPSDSNDSHQGQKLTFLTNYRASMLLVTAICILGVDFQAFPRRFAKTEELGFGLMDIGVGSFVFSAGIVSPTSRSKVTRNAYKSLPLVVLGILKYVSTQLVDYHNHMSEYGAHWNFFITLAIVQVVCGSCTCFLGQRPRTIFVVGVILAIGHELALVNLVHYSWIFNLSDSTRLQSSFWIANIEGLVSLVGYSSIFLLGSSLRPVINSLSVNPRRWRSSALLLTLLTCVWIFCMNEQMMSLPSRRLCNLTYIIWMSVYNMMLLILFAGIQCMTDTAAGAKPHDKEATRSSQAMIYPAIGKHGLAFFLVANLLTGLANLSLQPALMDNLRSRAILLAYTSTLCVLCVVFNTYNKE